MNRLRASNVGPQATGKSIFLQLLKLLVDRPAIHRTMKAFGIPAPDPERFFDLSRCWVHEPTNGGPRYHLRLWQAIIETWPGARLVGMPVIESPTWPATIETSFTTPDGAQHYLEAHTWPPVSGMDCPIEILSDSHVIMNARATR